MKKRIEMREINELLYQLHVVDQTVTQLFEQQLGISLTRYQILQFLVQQASCNQIPLTPGCFDPAFQDFGVRGLC